MSDTAKAAHTTGPWSADKDNWVVSPDGGFVAQCFDGTRQSPDDEILGAANAGLVATAPDMLAICEIFLGGDERFQVAVGGNPMVVDKMLANARIVVAKARGQSLSTLTDLERAGAGNGMD